MWREQPSQSKSSILPALPEGEPSVVLFIYVFLVSGLCPKPHKLLKKLDQNVFSYLSVTIVTPVSPSP